MTLTKDKTTGSGLDKVRAEKLFGDAEKAFDRAVRILEYACDNLENVGDITEAEVLKDLRGMQNALNHAVTMREKAREAGVERFGDQGTGTLDLDAAKLEIGLRLACLRGQGGGEELS